MTMHTVSEKEILINYTGKTRLTSRRNDWEKKPCRFTYDTNLAGIQGNLMPSNPRLCVNSRMSRSEFTGTLRKASIENSS